MGYALLTLLAIANMALAIWTAADGHVWLAGAAFIAGLLLLFAAHRIDPLMREDGE